MNLLINTTMFSYREDIAKNLFLTEKERNEIKNKTVNLIFATGRDITMRTLCNVINHIRQIANFSDEQEINFELSNNFKGTSQIEVLIHD